MPHDVTMPQLGMAQDAGRLVAWLKAPGDAVARGEALFEVETDKATMEVESQADGFLTGVSAAAGEDVPVGQVIARISDTVEDEAEDPPDAREHPADRTKGVTADLPEGKPVTMPQLGMSQDSGLLVGWLREPGEAVAADDPLFEVETDKSTVEVNAGFDGWLAATLAEPGEEVPVGDPVAIVSAEKPAAPVTRSAKAAPPPATPVATPDAAEAPAPSKPPTPARSASAVVAPAPATGSGDRILASPKARRLALEQGLDLNRLAEAGHPQPFHVRDLAALEALPAPAAAATAVAGQTRRLTAECAADGFADFATWAAATHGLTDADALLAGLAAASFDAPAPVVVAIERPGVSKTFEVATPRTLSGLATSGAPPGLVLRDLRHTPLRDVALGADDAPVLTLTASGAGLSITLECAADQLEPAEAIHLLTEFAGRIEQPLRHLL